MIREMTVYKCICFKCKHLWVTKTFTLPEYCVKCKTKKWNDDYQFNLPQIEDPQTLLLTKTQIASTKFDGIVMNDAMAQFMAKTQAVEIVPEVIVEDWQFTSDKPTQQDSGDWLRYQFLVSNPKKRRTVVVDEDDFDYVRRVL